MGEKQPLGLQECPGAMRTKLWVWGVKRPEPKAENQNTTKRPHETSPKQLKRSRERSAAHYLSQPCIPGTPLHHSTSACTLQDGLKCFLNIGGIQR